MTKYDNETLKIQNKLLYGLTKTSNLTFNTIKYIEKVQTALYKVIVPKQFRAKNKRKGDEIDGETATLYNENKDVVNLRKGMVMILEEGVKRINNDDELDTDC